MLHPVDGPGHRSAALTLPAVAVDQADGPLATRTLVLGRARRRAGARLPTGRVPRSATPRSPCRCRTPSRWWRQVDPDAGRHEQRRAAPAPRRIALQRLGIGFLVVAAAGAGRHRAAARHHDRPDPARAERRLRPVAGRARPSPARRGAGPAAAAGPGPAGRRARPPAAGRAGGRAATPGSAPPCPAAPAGRQIVLAEPASAGLARHASTASRCGRQQRRPAGLRAARPAAGTCVVRSVDDRHRLLLVQGVGLVVDLPAGAADRSPPARRPGDRMRAVLRTAVVLVARCRARPRRGAAARPARAAGRLGRRHDRAGRRDRRGPAGHPLDYGLPRPGVRWCQTDRRAVRRCRRPSSGGRPAERPARARAVGRPRAPRRRAPAPDRSIAAGLGGPARSTFTPLVGSGRGGDPDDQPRSVLLSGIGTLAPGLVASQVSLLTAGDLRGLSTVACQQPSAQTWLVGGAGTTGHRGRVILTNPTPNPVTVNLSVFGAKGAVTSTAARGHRGQGAQARRRPAGGVGARRGLAGRPRAGVAAE